MKTAIKSMFGLSMLAAAIAAGPAAAQQKEVTLGLPGIPPVFVTVQAYVAQQQKLFEKYGVKVNLRDFDSGAAAGRALVAGQIELSLTPSPLFVNMVSNNPSVDVVAVYGNERPDWLLGSMDAGIAKCEDVKGKPVGVDSLGGARSIALTQMLRQCGLKADDTQQVALGSNVGAAMVSGQLAVGVLHVDDVPIIERESKKKVNTIVDINDVRKINHYMAIGTSRKLLESQRDTVVRVIAALIDAQRFMSDPKNADTVAAAAAPTGRSPADAKAALANYVKMEFWPKGHGLDKANIEQIIADQKAVGGIRPDKTPVAYDRFVDLSVYEDALKLVK